MNEFLIGAQGDALVFMRPIPLRITREQAINLAAWLVAIADPLRKEFDAKLTEVQGS